ncbi:Bromodomain and WD repeat-containing protein 1, partial [Mucuna pruriens]
MDSLEGKGVRGLVALGHMLAEQLRAFCYVAGALPFTRHIMNMALQKYVPSGNAPSINMKRLTFSSKVPKKAELDEANQNHDMDVDIDLREVYFLIMHFLSAGPCHKTYLQFWNELLEHQLLPRRYHAWYSRMGAHSVDEDDDGLSFPLNYNALVERYPHIEKDHLVKLLKQLLLNTSSPSLGMNPGNTPNAADVPTLLGRDDRDKMNEEVKRPPPNMRWPHMKANQVHGLNLREIGGGFPRHHRAPSIRAACYAIAKPSTMVQKMQNIKRLRGHRNAVYCAIFDRSGRYVITGSDDRLVKIWSMETAYCLASCRGHDGDITDLAVSSNNALVASSSNDCVIRVWRLPDGLPISVLRGHTGAVTAIAFSPRLNAVYQLLSSSDDGSCRIWDARLNHDNIVTCSRDGSAIIWIPKSRRSHGKSGRWMRAYHLRVPPPPMPPQPQRGGPRQRILPTPRGTYVLDVHPFNPRIAMSAGYDGRTIVWDIWEGIPIRQGESQKDAKYDQFFLGDYRPLIQDTHGNVLD